MEQPAWLTPCVEKLLKAVLAANARVLMDLHGLSEAKVAELGKIGTGSVWRVLHLQNVNLETLAGLAKALGHPAWALLLPELDPTTKPVADTQERIDTKIESRAQELAHTMLADALHEQKLRQKAPTGRRRGDKPLAARQAPQEKPPVRTVRK